jgi:hypothetical protein
MGREKLRAFIGLRHPQRRVPLNFITIDCLPTDDATNAGPLSGRTHKHKQDPAISIGLFLIYLFISESGIAPVITQGRWLERSGLEFIIGVFAQLLGSELGESARFTRMTAMQLQDCILLINWREFKESKRVDGKGENRRDC